MAHTGELDLWPELLQHLKRSHPDICRQWFQDEIVLIDTDAGVVRLRVKDRLHRDYLQRHCAEQFDEAVREVTGRLVTVRFFGPDEPIPGMQAKSKQHRALTSLEAKPQPADQARNGHAHALNGNHHAPNIDIHTGTTPKPAIAPTRAELAAGRDALPINPDYSFENFVIGPENRLAHAAAVAVAETPGSVYNPLFIHGGVGLGKTHLLQAVCLTFLNNLKDFRLLYTSCDAFSTQFVSAVQGGRMSEFRHTFRDIDCLVIDDVHFLNKREQTQEEFFHTFNELYQAGRQIILSSDLPPNEIPDLEARLVSRFQSGLVVQMNPTLYETRVEIVRQKARLRNLEIPDEVATYIAGRVESNVRELEGALTRIQMQSLADAKGIDLELARLAMNDQVPEVRPEPTIKHIIDAVTEHFDVKLTDLQGRRKHKSIAHPRQVCMYLARKHTRYSLEEIGGYFGGRDHTTVIHALRTIAAKSDKDPDFKQVLSALERHIGVPEPQVGQFD